MQKIRQILFYKNYFFDFFNKQPKKVKEKIDQVLFAITIVDRISGKFFQHISGTNGLYEIRIEYRSNTYRIFCCLDEGKLIILFNAFQKKTQRTPREEIERAINIKMDYFNEKAHGNKE